MFGHFFADKLTYLRLGDILLPYLDTDTGFDVIADLKRRIINGEPLAMIPSTAITYSANHDVCGGGTGREYVTNLGNDGNEPWNKWFAGGYNTATISITFKNPQMVHRYKMIR